MRLHGQAATQGQIHMLVSRVTDPQNLLFVGVPLKNLLEDIAGALLARGVDVDTHFDDARSGTREWIYGRGAPRL